MTSVAAQPAADAAPGADGEAAAPSSAPSQPAASAPATPEDPNAPQYGIAIRLRNARVPKGLLELFVERAADGASNFGYGVELIRRKGNVELQLGFEYEKLTVGEGVWIERGTNVAVDQADYVLDPEHAPNNEALGWFTIEFTFMNHAPINKNIAFRYGGGAGLGILTGGLYRYDVTCNGATNNNPEPGCVPTARGGTGTGSGPVKYDLPPVFPVVNGIIGLQIKPIDKMVINLETGIRTVPFFGTSIGYFF
ncbi:MAG: hypothetical protein SFX73_11875 [Kofleriaceae bacterium]|nr:hypothetical protein [Kofleriaceae bacterium]